MSSLVLSMLTASNPQAESGTTPSSSEFKLVLACASADKIDRSSRDLDFLLRDPIDWQRVLRLAEHHGVTPFVYQALRQFPDAVPAATLEDLHRRHEHNTRRNLMFTAELIRILDEFDALGIAAIPYKGPVLAETVYGDLALREFSDLDVLVRQADVTRAKDALKTLHYAASTLLSAAEEHAYLDSGYEYSFDGPAGRNLLEIQWAILPRFYAVDLALDDLFARALPARVGGRTVKTLSAEDLLLVLCLHAAKHAWIRLCWLRDIAGVVQSQLLDWALVLERARSLGIERILGVSLMLVNRVLHASIPDSLHEKCRDDPQIEKLCDQIARSMPDAAEYNPESLDYFRLMFRLRERASDKLRFASRLAFTPSRGEWSVVRLPASLFPLYRLIRLFRLAGKVFSRLAAD